MITILAIFCHLALSYVHCGTLANRSNAREINEWSLNEVKISTGLEVRPTEHYTSKVKLTRYGTRFSLDAAENDDSEARNVLRFEIEELHALLDDTIYVIAQNSNRVIRMTLATRSEAHYFERFIEPTTPGQSSEVIRHYKIIKMVESDENLVIKRESITVDEEIPISLTVYAEFDRQENDIGKRRFVITGDVQDELNAVFNKGDYNLIRKGVTNRFVLEVRAPAGFGGKMYYGLVLTCSDDTPDKFAQEMRRDVSPSIVVPQTSLALVDNI